MEVNFICMELHLLVCEVPFPGRGAAGDATVLKVKPVSIVSVPW